MLTESEVKGILARMRTAANDLMDVEAKLSRHQLPHNIDEKISGLANTTGGLLLLGIDEESGFEVTGVVSPKKIAANLEQVLSRKLYPPVVAPVYAVEVESKPIIVAEIAAAVPGDRPVMTQATKKTYIRVGDGTREATPHEIAAMLAAKSGSAKDDQAPVERALITDLDDELIERYLLGLRANESKVLRGNPDRETVLRRTNVLVESEGILRPTLAGMLMFGIYPQEFFPQFTFGFAHFARNDGKQIGDTRFIDNRTHDGPIPIMLRDIEATLRRSMAKRADITGQGRLDVWEYPEVALREATINAVAHRDYGGFSQGSHIQIEMYPDRLRFWNNGGLFGQSIAEFEDTTRPEATTRNQLLVKFLMEMRDLDTNRAFMEFRGTGVGTMYAASRDAGKMLPKFQSDLVSFSVTFPNHALVGDDTKAWIDSLRLEGLTPSQVTGLAIMKNGGSITNQTYRTAAGDIDSSLAYRELQSLVTQGVVEMEGEGRWSSYHLRESHSASSIEVLASLDKSKQQQRNENVLKLIIESETGLSRADVEQMLGLKKREASHTINVLLKAGIIYRIGPERSPNTKYVAASPSMTTTSVVAAEVNR